MKTLSFRRITTSGLKRCRVAPIAGVLLGLFAAPVAAGMITEDFEGGFDPRFNHDVTGFMFWRTFSAVSPTTSLGLEPGADVITFDLDSSLRVDYAGVWAMSNCGHGCTSIEFIGSSGRGLFETVTGYPNWEFFDTASLDIGFITEIRLSASQSIFDDVSIHVTAIPEPATTILLGAGVMTATWRRRPRRRT